MSVVQMSDYRGKLKPRSLPLKFGGEEPSGPKSFGGGFFFNPDAVNIVISLVTDKVKPVYNSLTPWARFTDLSHARYSADGSLGIVFHLTDFERRNTYVKEFCKFIPILQNVLRPHGIHFDYDSFEGADVPVGDCAFTILIKEKQ